MGGFRAQQRLVPLEASAQMDAHLLTRAVRIAFNDRIHDTGMFLLQMEVIVLRTRSWLCALQFTAGG